MFENYGSFLSLVRCWDVTSPYLHRWSPGPRFHDDSLFMSPREAHLRPGLSSNYNPSYTGSLGERFQRPITRPTPIVRHANNFGVNGGQAARLRRTSYERLSLDISPPVPLQRRYLGLDDSAGGGW
jgi:hypothetical protein